MTDPERYFYAHEKLGATVDGLAAGRGDIAERLRAVYSDQGHRIPVVDGGEAEPELAQRIEQFHADMEAALPDLTDGRAAQLVETILDLASRVNNLFWTARGAR